MDWECTLCKEQNFSKATQCFKCKTPRGSQARKVPPRTYSKPPTEGKTLQGMVKSYNKNGFGFIMCTGGYTQDIYFRRENVTSRLLHPDMPGEQVSFEVCREGGKLVAKNVRALGEDVRPGERFGTYGSFKGKSKGGGIQDGEPPFGTQMRTGSWMCPRCKEHNFSRRTDCYKCLLQKPGSASVGEAPKGFSSGPAPSRAAGQPRFAFSDKPPEDTKPASPVRSVSPHAGARAIREQLLKSRGATQDATRSRSSSKSSQKQEEKAKRKAVSSSGTSSSSESSRKRSKKKKKRKTNKRRRSSSSSNRSSDVETLHDSTAATAASSSGAGDPEIEKAKSEAMHKLLELKAIPNKDDKMKRFRKLLREWHPDKNLQNVEVATAVFQFLQKGKVLMEGG